MEKTKKIQIFVFKNDKKEKDNQPDYQVSAKIGDNYDNIGAGWVKSKNDGKKFISMSLEVEKIRSLVNQELSTSEGKPMPFPNPDEELL